MSRISQTLSFLSHLSPSPVGPDTASEDAKVATVMEQFVPRKLDAVFGDQYIFQTTALRHCISAKLVLLAPTPCDTPPFAKSVIYLSSLSGSISATVFRRPDVETHFFCLYIFTREADVKVTLPSLFRGVVNIDRGQARYCRAFRDRMDCGLIQLDSRVPVENGDEIHIHAQGKIELRLMIDDGTEGVFSRMVRHVRRIFGSMQPLRRR